MKKITFNYLILMLIILVGFGLRLQYIDRSIRYDEALTVVAFGTVNPLTTLATYIVPNNHIFHSLLVNLSYRIGGMDHIFVRLPVFLAGILVIALSYKVAVKLYRNQMIGLLTATLVAISPALIDYSVSARGYMIQTVFTLVMIYLAHDLKTRHNVGNWLLLSVCAALSFLTLPTSIYSMGIVALWLLVSIWVENRQARFRRRLLLKNFVISMVLGAILTLLSYSLVIIYSGLDTAFSDPILVVRGVGHFLQIYIPTVWGRMGEIIHWGLPASFAFITLLLVLIATIFHRRLSLDAIPILIPGCIWMLVSTLALRVSPFPRNWLFLIPLYAMLMAVGLIYLLQNTPKSVQLASILVIGIVGSIYTNNNETIQYSSIIGFAENAEEGAFYIDEHLTEDDVLIAAIPTSYPLVYYETLHNLTIPHPTQEFDTLETYYHFYHLDNEVPLLDFLGVPGGERELVHQFEFGRIDKVTVTQD